MICSIAYRTSTATDHQNSLWKDKYYISVSILVPLLREMWQPDSSPGDTFVYDYTILTKESVCRVLVWIMNTKLLTVKVSNYPLSNYAIVLGITQCTRLVTETYIQIG